MRDENNFGGNVLDGASLEKALVEGKFDKPMATLVGMVKCSANQGHLSFASAGCDSWIDLPTSMIEAAEYVGAQHCKDHSHPVFRVSLHEPTDPQAKVLMALLAARPAPPTAMPPNLGSGAGIPPQMASVSPLMRPQSTSWCSGSTLWCSETRYIPWLGQVTVIYPCGTCINDPVYTAFGGYMGGYINAR
jgi:hypothetical protein